MSDSEHAPFGRLRDEPGSLERELLRSADDDRPATGVKEAAIAAVRSRHEHERRARRRSGLVAAAATMSLAAGVTLLARDRAPAPKLRPEPPVASGVTSASPSPSATPAPSPSSNCTPVASGSGDYPLIDDFEDGDSRLLLADKRAGSWVVFNDGTGQQQPRAGSSFPAARIPGGRGASRFGLHTQGSKFKKWGATLSVELSPRRCYDASAYAGIAFWARGQGRDRVAVKMTQVVGEEFGGSCVRDCYDGHGVDRTLTRDWQRYEVRWGDLSQAGFGAPLSFDSRSLFSVEFAVGSNQPFDYWIDDLSFLTR